MKKRKHRSKGGGLAKRCEHSPNGWNDCLCAWHFSFCYGTDGHGKPKQFRFSLDKLARARGEQPPRGKNAALAWADRLRSEIRSGTFTEPRKREPALVAAAPLTLDDVCDRYLREFVNTPTRRSRGAKEMALLVNQFRNAHVPAHGGTVRIGDKPIAEIRKADVEAVRAWRQQQQAQNAARWAKGGAVGINRMLSRARHLFNWALDLELIDSTPFRRGERATVKLTSDVENGRTRRLRPGEEQALLRSADPLMRGLITCMLHTGFRPGEALSLQFNQVRYNAKGEAVEIELPASKTKTGEHRSVPVSTRLRAELEMRKTAPDGREHPGSAFVFGNAFGEALRDVRRLWEDCVLKAHGIEPARRRGKLTAESRQAYRRLNLHLHDLRHEAGSRLLEAGATLADVQSWLGHGSVTTTATYLQANSPRLPHLVERMDESFAQTSHTEAEHASADAGISASEIPVTH